MDTTPISLLDDYHRQLLRAALGDGNSAKDAYLAWRKNFRLDDIDPSAFRVLGHLADTAKRHGIEEAELPRLNGAMKYTWLSNILHTRTLGAALAAFAQANIPVLLLKGGALFARYPHLAAFRESADYDLLVKRDDAARAISTLIASGMRTEGLRAEQFVGNDFETLHGVHFINEEGHGTIDLHWWPLPQWSDREYVDALFANAESASFAGRDVRVPSLADQLFLTVARTELWDINEQFTRTLEAAHILRASECRLDWKRFVRLAMRYHCAPIAAAVLDLLQKELGLEAPKFVLEELRAEQPLFLRTELKAKSAPPYKRTRTRNLLLKTVAGARERHTHSTFPHQLDFAIELVRVLKQSVFKIWSPGETLQQFWLSHARKAHLFDGPGPAYISGFSIPEDMGRWTDGKFAALTLPVNAAPGSTVRLKLSVIPVEPARGGPFSFRICTGRDRVRKHTLPLPPRFEPADMFVTAEVIDHDHPRILIALELTDACIPITVGRSTDMRSLGLMFCNVELA